MAVSRVTAPRFVLVTGASGGVGRLLVERLASSGFGVIAASRGPAPPAQREMEGGRIVPLALDLTAPGAVARAAGEVAHLTGRAGLDGLVNAAGVIAEGPLDVVDPEDVRRQFEVNVLAPLALTQAVLPLLRTAKGRVVNIGAATARTTVPFFGAISASKAALASLSDAMRMEFAPFGVQVSLLEPGALQTGIFDRSAAQLEATLRRQPGKARFYRPAIEAMQAANRKAGADRPEVVVEAVMEALTSPRVRPRRLVGKGSGVLALLARLPTGARDGMLMDALGIRNALGASLAAEPDGPAPTGVRAA